MERTSATEAEPPIDVVREPPPPPPRQRWRLVLARSADAPALAGRDLADAWGAALDASGLPVFRAPGKVRARLAFGAPIPVGLVAEQELADILLTELLPVWQVREALVAHLPAGWRLLDLHDVWLGGQALAAQVAAADYRIDVGAADSKAIGAAIETVLRARELPRQRQKGGSAVTYDLRPLLVGLGVAAAGPPVLLRTRTRFHPVLGTGRPEEVVAALGDVAGMPLVIGSVVRERLVLANEMD